MVSVIVNVNKEMVIVVNRSTRKIQFCFFVAGFVLVFSPLLIASELGEVRKSSEECDNQFKKQSLEFNSSVMNEVDHERLMLL